MSEQAKPIWVEAFRAGEKFRDMFGRESSMTVGEMRDMVKRYRDERQSDAPFVNGHGKILFSMDEAEADGWITDAKVNGKTLMLRVDNLDDDVSSKIGRKKIKYVSLGYRGTPDAESGDLIAPFTIHHLAHVTIPAVGKLAELSVNSGNNPRADLFCCAAIQLKESDGESFADETPEGESEQEITTMSEDNKGIFSRVFGEKGEKAEKMIADMAALSEANTKQAEQIAVLSASMEALKAENHTLRKERDVSELRAFAEAQAKEQHLTPAARDGLLAFAANLEPGDKSKEMVKAFAASGEKVRGDLTKATTKSAADGKAALDSIADVRGYISANSEALKGNPGFMSLVSAANSAEQMRGKTLTFAEACETIARTFDGRGADFAEMIR